MGIGKRIYEVMSKKFKKKQERIAKFEKEKCTPGYKPPIPAVAENNKNHPTFSKSSNISPSLQKKRLLGPNEGGSAVNGKAGDATKKLITKVRPKINRVPDGAGAIKQGETAKTKKSTISKVGGRKCSLCGRPGHTKRTCRGA